uniref:Sushi domain-containing protein n=1 Tax=Myripristis murdjan TaxID=586833 RepID=A0A667YDL2_9TELE
MLHSEGCSTLALCYYRERGLCSDFLPSAVCTPPPSCCLCRRSMIVLLQSAALYSHGEKVYYDCEEGFTPLKGSRSVHCNNGKWTVLTLKCERKSCGSAGEVENGQFVYTGAEFGDTVTAVCNEGYLLVGRGTRTCTNDGWDGRVAVCEAVECEEPQQATNAVRIGTPAQSYMFRSVIGYRCPSGILTGQREIWCTKDGTWSAPPPVCKVRTCDTPNVPNAMWMWKSTPYQYRDIVSFECVRGHVMYGASTVVCGQTLVKRQRFKTKKTLIRLQEGSSYSGRGAL